MRWTAHIASAPPPTLPATARTKLAKHALLIAGHPTSISLEEAFWQRLRAVAERRAASVAALVATIDAGRGEANLSSAIRVFLLEDALHIAEPPLAAPRPLGATPPQSL